MRSYLVVLPDALPPNPRTPWTLSRVRDIVDRRPGLYWRPPQLAQPPVEVGVFKDTTAIEDLAR
jgi:hypothetical protein